MYDFLNGYSNEMEGHLIFYGEGREKAEESRVRMAMGRGRGGPPHPPPGKRVPRSRRIPCLWGGRAGSGIPRLGPEIPNLHPLSRYRL